MGRRLVAIAFTLPALPALGQNATTGLSATARANFETIGIVATISGDGNGNATAALEVRVAAGAWAAAHPLPRIDATRFVGSALFLSPATDYEVRVTLSDPDGVTNPVHAATARTRANTFPAANGNDYYVAPAGNDGGAGSAADPWRTVQHAANVAQPGDEVFLRQGVYYETVTLPRPGTATAPIVFRSYPGETAVLDGADPALIANASAWTNQGGGVWSVPLAAGTSYVAVDGSRLYPYASLPDLQGLVWGTDGGFYAGGGLLYVRFPGGGTPAGVATYVSRYAAGFLADTVGYLQFRGLEIRHYGADDYGKGIYLRYASSCLVDGCRIHHNIAGIWMKGDSSDNVIQGSTFYDTPLHTWGWDASKAAGNAEHGAVVIDGTWTGRGNVIRNNTIYDYFDGSHLCGDVHADPDDTDFHGNDIRRCNDDGFETDGTCINVRIWGNTITDVLMGASLASAEVGPTFVVRNLITGYGNVASGSQYTGSPFKFNVSGVGPSGPMLIYHNTCATSTPATIAFTIYDLSRWSWLRSRNNVFAGNDYGYRYVNSANDPIDLDYDLLYTTAANRFAYVQGTTYATLPDFRAGEGMELGGVSAPPQFTNPAAGDYTLVAGSPAIDAGIAIPGINDGFIGAGPDMGAFESTAGVPVAQFAGSPLAGPAPLSVQFTDQSTGNVTSWSWTFGDGGTSAAASPSHTYLAAGSYDVSLTVSGPSGSDTETKLGYVTVTGSQPQANYVSGRGRGFPNPNDVRVHRLGPTQVASFTAYGSGQWGTLVSAGDVDGTGLDNPITGPGPGAVYGPHVRAFQPGGTPITKVSFYAYGTLRYGVNVASAALDADLPAEIVTGAGPGAVFGPHVRGFNYDGVALTAIAKIGFFAYGTLKFGVNPGAADIDGDGFGEMLTGPGPSSVFGPQVRAFNYDGAAVASLAKVNFTAFTAGGFGANVAAGAVDGDAFAEIVVGRGPGATQASQVRGFDFDAAAIVALPGFDVTPYATSYGARAAGGDVDGNGRDELVTGPGEAPSAPASVRTFRYTGSALAPIAAGDFDAFPSAYGVIVGCGYLGW